MPWEIRTGTTGKHNSAQSRLKNPSKCLVQGESHMLLLMDKSGLAKHKLTVEKGINMSPLYQQNQTLFALSLGDCGLEFVP